MWGFLDGKTVSGFGRKAHAADCRWGDVGSNTNLAVRALSCSLRASHTIRGEKKEALRGRTPLLDSTEAIPRGVHSSEEPSWLPWKGRLGDIGLLANAKGI